MENVYNLLKISDIDIERNINKNSCRKCKLKRDNMKSFVKTEWKYSKNSRFSLWKQNIFEKLNIVK